MFKVFFIIRKKFTQTSFLHVYHHSGMIVLSWIGTKYIAGGQTVVIPFLNSIVHAIMYSYYLITILEKDKQRFYWFKKYVTLIQMVSFNKYNLHYCFYSQLILFTGTIYFIYYSIS